MKHFNKKLSTGLLFIIVLSLFSFREKLPDRYFEIIRGLDIFTTLYKELNTFYVDEINPTELLNTGIEAMLQSLDPYTNYIPEDRIEDYRIMSTGQYGGIGTAVARFENEILVLMTFEGSPAEKAGVKIGDRILKIDNKKVDDLNTKEINTLLKGQLGTSLSLTITRKNENKPIVLNMERDRISIKSVPFYGMVSNDIGYVRLTEFSNGAGADIRAALIELKEKGASKLMLDLRGNPGGLLNEAIEVSNLFIPKGKEVVSTKGKIEEWNKNYKATKNPVDVNIPIAVLISNGSASASEIVAGVMQDYDRGILVGQKSFGKGLVQATRPLSYNSQLKLTTAKYYIPSGRCIQAIDYSNRNEDGSVGQIQDSLKQEFKTQAGRSVYDGGGVSPDVEVEAFNYAPITIQLIKNGLIFSFVTDYYYDNLNNIPDPEKFEISDPLFEKFTNWLQNKNYSYESDTEKTLDKLINEAKDDKYYTFLEKELAAVLTEIESHKNEDISTFEDEIKQVLKEEIMARYHKRQGMIQSSFKTDKEVRKAIEVLNDSNKYRSVLSAK